MLEIDQVFQTDTLLRRVSSTDPNYIREDGTLTSLAFKPRKTDTDGVSVDIERLTTHDKAVTDRVKYRLYGLPASVPLDLGLPCVHAPMPDNTAHALIQGVTSSLAKKLSSSAAKII